MTGNSHNLTLSPTSSSIKLAGINLSGVNELTIGGDLDLAGDLTAQNIDIQGDTTLLGDANLTATGTAFRRLEYCITHKYRNDLRIRNEIRTLSRRSACVYRRRQRGHAGC